jgi:hypothetical protein
MTTWQVWSDDYSPVLDGVTEEVAKKFVEEDTSSTNLYIQDDEGNEYEYDGRKWRKI